MVGIEESADGLTEWLRQLLAERGLAVISQKSFVRLRRELRRGRGPATRIVWTVATSGGSKLSFTGDRGAENTDAHIIAKTRRVAH